MLHTEIADPGRTAARTKEETTAGSPGYLFQVSGLVSCFVLAVLMVINTQLSGEAMWFWYSTLFGHGVKLYSQLHTPLQPLLVLEMSAWMRMFGSRLLVYEIPSLLHACVLAFGFFLVLRESSWPDWQKAIVLFGGFVFTVIGHSYRFDDYHVLAEILILYALWLLLVLGRPRGVEPRQTLWLVAALGSVCGLAFTTRVTDGAALIVAAGLCLCFLLPRRQRARSLLLFGAAIVLTILIVVGLTGDSLHDYLYSSLFHAAASKGGTGSIFAAPFMEFVNGLDFLRSRRRTSIYVAILFLAGWAIQRYWKRAAPYIVPLQLVLAAVMYKVLPVALKREYKTGYFYTFIVLVLTTCIYLIVAGVLVRYFLSKAGKARWDAREILVVLPLLEWASYSAGAAAEPLTNYYAPVVLLMLLYPVIEPVRRGAVWLNQTVVTLFALVCFWGVYTKVKIPYSWQNYRYEPMFRNRELFWHPVHGQMYIDRDLLAFSQRVCADIGAVPGKAGPELLSLPYPYPNYFCNTPPWHDYVQTFFDTSPRATIEGMMTQLAIDPPKWIIYQRQLNIMVGSERLYNHGRRLAQRDLDAMIMGKIASGQWKLVDESNYLAVDWWRHHKDTDWYIIETHP